jgi:hypothetical protein
MQIKNVAKSLDKYCKSQRLKTKNCKMCRLRLNKRDRTAFVKVLDPKVSGNFPVIFISTFPCNFIFHFYILYCNPAIRLLYSINQLLCIDRDLPPTIGGNSIVCHSAELASHKITEDYRHNHKLLLFQLTNSTEIN